MTTFRISPKQMLAIIVIILSILALSPLSAQTKRNTLRPVYTGYELAFGVQHFTLNSNIPQLNQKVVIQQGVTAGIKMSNTRAAIRATAGLYYSDGSFPYSLDILEGGFTGSYYILRTNKRTKYHTIEPYILLSTRYQQATFFGSYLEADHQNKSTSNEKKIGSVSWFNSAVGGGFEFQLENKQRQFIHFFLEGKIAVAKQYMSSDEAFTETYIQSPITWTLGMSFGKFRNR